LNSIVRVDVTKVAPARFGACRVGGAVTVCRKKRFLCPVSGFGCAFGFRSMRQYHSLYKVMNTRTLKIESVGDFFYGRVSPKIRISGRWLERAGFKPGHRVEVQVSQPGTLTLRFQEQFSPLSDETDS